jgi:hypothetical protein
MRNIVFESSGLFVLVAMLSTNVAQAMEICNFDNAETASFPGSPVASSWQFFRPFTALLSRGDRHLLTVLGSGKHHSACSWDKYE